MQPAVHRLHFRLYAEIADRTFSLFRHLCCTRYGTYSHKPWLKKFGPFGGLRAQARVGIESCKIMFLGGHLLFTCSDTFAVGCMLSFRHNAQHHRQTDR